jgi:nicotinate-nucleotide adenylyltransferase
MTFPIANTSSCLAAALKRLPQAAPGMRVGLLGGSFNPPHHGHRHVALMALKRLGLDRVWCMTSPGNPLKSSAELEGFDARLVDAARVLRHPRIDVTGFEAALNSAYTIDSLRFLKRRHPNVRFVWIMGGDNLACFHHWRNWREILALTPIAIFDRPEWRLKALAAPAARAAAKARRKESNARHLALTPPPAWTFVSIPLSGESSTRLRRLKRTATI